MAIQSENFSLKLVLFSFKKRSVSLITLFSLSLPIYTLKTADKLLPVLGDV